MSENPDHLEESSTKERIELVEGKGIREYGQIIIAFVLIGLAIGYLIWYTAFSELAADEFKLALAEDMRVLVIMGVGAALAIFGLGRTVGRK